jgi:NitT/TauT family transport system substrate-binding protein
MSITQGRRRFLTNVALAGATGLGGIGAAGLRGGRKSFAAEPPPETTTVRFEKDSGTCIAPQAFEELPYAEGFTDIHYVDLSDAHIRRAEAAAAVPIPDMLAHGDVDFARSFAPSLLISMNAGAPLTILAGLHLGCYEVFGKESIHGIADLKGRTVGVDGPDDRSLLVIMTAWVGLDPARDIRWVASGSVGSMQLFADGKIDAFLTLPPALQEVQARNIGHVVLSEITDRPWSEYYCCMLAARTEFVRRYPVATKRVLRALLNGADLCVSEPKRVARLLVDRGYATRYDYALQGLREVRYDVWRDYDPEDSLRFYGLRLYEVGLIKSDPEKLIAEHTDWRFLNELKHGLKA